MNRNKVVVSHILWAPIPTNTKFIGLFDIKNYGKTKEN